LALLALIDAEYTRHPFYGSRKMVAYLATQGYRVNRKRVQRLMRVLGLAGMAPGPDSTRPHPQSSGPTKSGVPTSPTSAWHAGSRTW